MSGGSSDLLTIGAMSRASGATPRAIRFYEGLGLVSSCKRSPGGYRLFQQRELAKLNLVTGLRRSGFSIKEIARLFSVTKKSRTAASAAKTVNETLLERAAEIRKASEALKLLAADMARSAEVLSRCLECDRSFDELNCGECEKFRDFRNDSYPMAVKALWPLTDS
jgi:DNA-binding transcriptional MerR regulator